MEFSKAHYNYAQQIPTTIQKYIDSEIWKNIPNETLNQPIEIMCLCTHNTLPNMSQKYHVPIWKTPTLELEQEDKQTVAGNASYYLETKKKLSRLC